MSSNHKYWEITEKIIESAMNVHNVLGCGFQEFIYQKAMIIECGLHELQVKNEVEMPIFYRGIHIGTRRVDLFINDKILVELKAVSQLENVHLAQAINYLEAFRLEVGLLINFGSTKLQFRRLMLNEEQLKKQQLPKIS
jgi:GxxExxY protein